MEDLSLVCSGLGIDEEDDNGNRIGYSKSENCLDNLKDLLRFLRRDDPENREVFMQVCKWKIVSKDLIPIIRYYQAERSLVLNAVKVLVFLTMPIEPSSHNIPQQTEYLWELKSAITCSDTIGVIVSLLEGPLENLERDSFNEDDWKLVQLVLTLFRNILAIQDISLLQKVGASACHLLSLRDRFLELLFHENMMDLIIVISQHISDSQGYLRQDNLLLLEIFHYILMGQEPELIVKARAKDSKGGGITTSVDSLKSIMEEEEEKKRLIRQSNARRHSQFSGTFTRLTMDGSKAVYQGNPSSASQNVLHNNNKIQRGMTKKIVWDHGSVPSTKDDILVLLHDFLNQFLLGGYNVLMQTISEDIEKEHPAVQKRDIVVFFKVAQFVTSFQYQKQLTLKRNLGKDDSHNSIDECADSTLFKGDVCGPIAASLNESMFLLVISRWRDAFDGLKETKDYKFLSAASSVMKSMMLMLDLVLKISPEDSREPQTVRVLLYKLFYDQTDQGMTQFLLSLMKTFDSHKQPKSDLADLVEIIHIIVRLMEDLQKRGTLRVSKKSRRARKKKVPATRMETKKEPLLDDVTMQDQLLSSNGGNTHDLSISPTKAQEDTTSDNQENIRNTGQVEEPERSALEMGNLVQDLHQMDDRTTEQADEDLTCSSDSSSSDENVAATCEVDFKVSTVVLSFANHSIIRNLCWLLRFYKSNSPVTNHYIIGILRRITDDLDLSPMLYQLSLLTTFYGILDEQKSCPCKEYTNITDFLTTLVRQMLRKMKNQPLLFVEVLFWKSRKECHYINAEYLLHELGHLRKETKSWGNMMEDGDIGSSQAKEWFPRSLADALGDDEADVVISHEPHQKMRENFGETEEDISSSSSDDGKENSDQGVNSAKNNGQEGLTKRKKRLALTEELVARIKELYEKYKDDGNCNRLIAESLDPAGNISPAQVFNKLKQLGLKGLSRKRSKRVDKSVSFISDQNGTKEKETDDSTEFEEALQKQSFTNRKRVQAFNKDQEEMIKDLFEQFKEHRRCSYMIAKALGDDNSFTAAQVSRKLKQLGLHVPKQRGLKSEDLRDKDMNDSNGGKGRISDDETLVSIRNRHKTENGDKSLLEDQSSEEVSDSERLDSILRRKLHSKKAKIRKINTSVDGKISEQNSGGIPKDVVERDVNNEPTGTNVDEIHEDTTLNTNIEDRLELDRTVGENMAMDSEVNKEDNLGDEQIDEKLADMEDDDATAIVSPIQTSAVKRKLRMVVDDEDD